MPVVSRISGESRRSHPTRSERPPFAVTVTSARTTCTVATAEPPVGGFFSDLPQAGSAKARASSARGRREDREESQRR